MDVASERAGPAPEAVDEVRQVFDALFRGAPQADEESQREFYDLSVTGLMKLKVSCRNLHAKLDEQRKVLEAKKVAIDKLQLSHDNVLYRKAHLTREIRACKDLATPNLADVEDELGRCLGSSAYCADLAAATRATLADMKAEMENRIEAKRKLDRLHEEGQAVAEALDKKRKFLAEIPLKVAVIKSAALELKKQFQSV